ncbi:MAG: alpha/beta fold hydrolase [Bacilli bacterium]|nr:alpha/beta fold hydrolase [Bacilli bacterium]
MKRKAVLIIHGFVGCLYDNEYLMNYLELDNKFDVFARTLPGHYENEMYQKATYQDWINFTDSIIQNLIKFGYKEIYLIGHSMGGVLASYAATKYKQIKKVVFINAAFNYLNLKQNKVDILENKDYKDYLEVFDKVLHTSIPFFLEFVKLVKEHHNTLKSVYKESLILQSDSDQVVPIENGIKIYDDLGSKNKYLTYLKQGRHEILNGEDENTERKKEIAEYIRLFLKGGYKWRMTWKEKI